MAKKILTQEEIDAMVAAARGGAAAGGAAKAKARTVTAWDTRMAGQIGREQMRSINLLHEGFARNLTHSLGAYLRVTFATAMVSAEHFSFSDFLGTIPEVTYLASCKLDPVGATALLQLELAVAFPLIDVLLGGEGKGSIPNREITEIEEQILETVMHIVFRELQTAWSALSLEFQFEQRQQPGQVHQLMPGEEKTLLTSFEVTVLESRGTFNLVVPALVSNALLRKISASAGAKPRMRSDSSERLRTRVLQCPFQMDLCMTSLRAPMRDLAGLVPGKLLIMRRSVQHRVSLLAGDREVFRAAVARQGTTRAAQVLERCLEGPSTRKRRA